MRPTLAWCPLICINHRGNPVPMYRAQASDAHCTVWPWTLSRPQSTCGLRQDSRAPEFLHRIGTNTNASTTNTTQHTTKTIQNHLEHISSFSRTRLQTLSGVHGNHDLREPGPSMSRGQRRCPAPITYTAAAPPIGCPPPPLTRELTGPRLSENKTAWILPWHWLGSFV